MMIWQEPAAAGSLQLWHWPSQRSAQHTPSVQKPPRHCSSAVHTSPRLSLPRHTPPAQNSEEPHCASVVQLPLHAVEPQVKGEQACCCRPEQEPVPMHLPGNVAIPEVQVGARHSTSLPA